jgi:hypothetical protein
MAQNPKQESDFLNTLKDYQIQSKLSGNYQTPLNSPLKGLWANLQSQEQALSSRPSRLDDTENIDALKQFQGMKNTFNTPQSLSRPKGNITQPSSQTNQDPNRSLFLNSTSKLYAPSAASYDDNTKNQLSKDLNSSYGGLASQPTNLEDNELVNALKQIYQSSGSPALYPSTTPETPSPESAPTTQPNSDQGNESDNWLRQYGETHGIDPQQIEDFIGGKIDSVDTPDNDPNADLENETMDPSGTYNVIPSEESETDQDIQDPETQQDLQDIYSSPQFADSEHEQQTMMKFANNPQLQNHFMSQNPQVVMGTALGQSLEGIANQYMVEPGNPMSERYRQRFDQGTGVYQDPFSGEQVSRPNFFQRLSSALKYVFSGGNNKHELHNDQMQLRNSQSQPQRLPFTENNPFTPSTVMHNPLPYMNMGNIGTQQEDPTYSSPPSAYLGAGGSYGTSDGMMAGLYSPPLFSR